MRHSTRLQSITADFPSSHDLHLSPPNEHMSGTHAQRIYLSEYPSSNGGDDFRYVLILFYNYHPVSGNPVSPSCRNFTSVPRITPLLVKWILTWPSTAIVRTSAKYVLPPERFALPNDIRRSQLLIQLFPLSMISQTERPAVM